ncbi:hypothetical protein cyc_05631 [Cyclospora cayetanensis]|uniref:Uncharacterized protein n=1 Tax=Cyclospora cayetanensis TaxID=88456 RepID=A0A1D3CX45_9EIME|nr:hypothetical protein cyc_05631 [Cyclospora cayetanensis]
MTGPAPGGPLGVPLQGAPPSLDEHMKSVRPSDYVPLKAEKASRRGGGSRGGAPNRKSQLLLQRLQEEGDFSRLMRMAKEQLQREGFVFAVQQLVAAKIKEEAGAAAVAAGNEAQLVSLVRDEGRRQIPEQVKKSLLRAIETLAGVEAPKALPEADAAAESHTDGSVKGPETKVQQEGAAAESAEASEAPSSTAAATRLATSRWLHGLLSLRGPLRLRSGAVAGASAPVAGGAAAATETALAEGGGGARRGRGARGFCSGRLSGSTQKRLMQAAVDWGAVVVGIHEALWHIGGLWHVKRAGCRHQPQLDMKAILVALQLHLYGG